MVLQLRATDDISGVSNLEIISEGKTISQIYSESVSVPISRLASASVSIKNMSVNALEVRVKDGAGNWSARSVVTITSTNSVPEVAVTLPSVAVTVPSVAIITSNKIYAGKSLATRYNVKIFSSKATLTLSVAKSSAKSCKISGSKLKTLNKGRCVVTFTVQEPAPKKGKRPKATKTTKTLVVQ